MSDPADIVATDAGGHRERPFLYTWNRRLRHLHGISIRNLNITPPVSRLSGKTIADDDVQYNLKSPAKLLAQKESKSLHHSRSSSDLTSPTKKIQPSPQKASTSYVKDEIHLSRPAGGKLRRRSTLHWTGASPLVRQHKLEDVVSQRMADTWLSIHHQDQGTAEPIYVSEVMEKSMNPSFRCFDLEMAGPLVTRLDELQLKVWAKNANLDDYHLLIELNVNLRSLQFIGRTLENFHQPLPSNCVLFHLSDGIYTSFTDMPVEGQNSTKSLAAGAKAGDTDTTSSYDALMQLANLDDCIQDALATRQKIESQITSLLDSHKGVLDLTKSNVQEQETAAYTERAISAEKKQIRQFAKRRDDLLKNLQLRKDTMAAAGRERDLGHSKIDELAKQAGELQQGLNKDCDLAAGQIRRICETLSVIYPLEPIKNKALHFTIRGIHLPNSNFGDTNRDEIAAALGFTSHLVHLLSLYLSVPLPYPIESNGASSFIDDPISMNLAQRRFPLHPTSVSYKFEYGVFLLNKDIEFLMSKAGLRMLDIRHTLPNLKYLLYVLTAGSDELPARKAGGIKGLMVGRVTPSLSRRGSDESTFSNTSYFGKNGGLVIPKEKEKGSGELDDPFATSPNARAKTMPYRSSLLRDSGQ